MISLKSVGAVCVEHFNRYNAFSLVRYRFRYRCSVTRPLVWFLLVHWVLGLSELATLAIATARSARLPVLKKSRRAHPSRCCSRSRQFGLRIGYFSWIQGNSESIHPLFLHWITWIVKDLLERKCQVVNFAEIHLKCFQRIGKSSHMTIKRFQLCKKTIILNALIQGFSERFAKSPVT